MAGVLFCCLAKLGEPPNGCVINGAHTLQRRTEEESFSLQKQKRRAGWPARRLRSL